MIIYLNHLLFYSSTLQLIVLLVRYTWSICFRFISIDAINNQKSFILHFFALFGFDFPFFSALNLLHPHIKTKSNACHQKTFHIVSLLKFIAVPAKSFNIFQFQCKFMLKNGDEKNSILCYPSKGSPIWRKLAMLLGEKKIVHSFYYHRRVHRSSALLNLHIFFFRNTGFSARYTHCDWHPRYIQTHATVYVYSSYRVYFWSCLDLMRYLLAHSIKP